MSNKVTVKVEKAEDVRVGDLVCGFPVRVAHPSLTYVQVRYGEHGVFDILIPIIEILCDSGHVTRDVDAAEAVEWFDHNDTHWSARFSGDVIGVVAKDGRFYFKVYDPRFTGVIEAKFLELTGGAK